MTRGLMNWTFRDIDSFLKENNFILHNTNGSHYYYRGHINGVLKIVCVPFHGSKNIKPRTVRAIIIQSGIDQNKWINN